MEEQSWAEPVWDSRSYRKHLKANRRQWERSMTRAWTAEKGQPSQYDPNLSLDQVREMEIGCVTGHGTLIQDRSNKRTFYQDVGRNIGASAGQFTQYIFVEFCINGSVHGYPITWDELVSKKGGPSMNCLEIHLPEGAEVSNYLYADMDADDLTQDIVTVSLPNGFYIDVGWYPEHDPSGCYWVRVFREYWDNQMIPEIKLENPHEVVLTVERLARLFCDSQVSVSQSSTKQCEILV